VRVYLESFEDENYEVHHLFNVATLRLIYVASSPMVHYQPVRSLCLHASRTKVYECATCH
jgi:hypothetical protein